MKSFIWLLLIILIPLPWMFLELTGQGHHLSPALISLLSGVAIIGAAFLLSWGAELAERDIPSSLALIILALISVLPEYAVDLHFAWEAGKNPEYKAYAVANMTGANRVLIGLGWSLVVLLYCFKHQRSEIQIDRSQSLELRMLMLATLYSLVIPLKGTLSWVDILIFFGLFLYYAVRASQGEHRESEPDGIVGELDKRLSTTTRRIVVLAMLAFSGYAIWLSAEPFAEGLVKMGRVWNVDEFLLVQWLAPFASESPEFIIALLFAWKGRGSIGIGALISSKINQWTLLVGAIPLVYALSRGALVAMDLDHRQKEELLLTSAQSLFAAVVIADFRFARWEAVALLVLFMAQLLLPNENIRHYFSIGYLAGAVLLLATSKLRREMLWRAVTFR
jgi:cation:H+ antiporter